MVGTENRDLNNILEKISSLVDLLSKLNIDLNKISDVIQKNEINDFINSILNNYLICAIKAKSDEYKKLDIPGLTKIFNSTLFHISLDESLKKQIFIKYGI